MFIFFRFFAILLLGIANIGKYVKMDNFFYPIFYLYWKYKLHSYCPGTLIKLKNCGVNVVSDKNKIKY